MDNAKDRIEELEEELKEQKEETHRQEAAAADLGRKVGIARRERCGSFL